MPHYYYSLKAGVTQLVVQVEQKQVRSANPSMQHLNAVLPLPCAGLQAWVFVGTFARAG